LPESEGRRPVLTAYVEFDVLDLVWGESLSSRSRSFARDLGVNHASMRKVLLRRSQTEEAVSMSDVLQRLKFAWL
jgi:hypothetical protein